MKKIRIRKAGHRDSKELIRLINLLADYEKLEPPDKSARKRIIRDSFSPKAILKILLAEVNGKAVGYAIYFFTYSSFLARRTLYLEDIFIVSEYRNKGIGKLFFNKLLNVARKNKCGRMEWVVLDWNTSAIKFYESLGATELKEWKTFRMNLIDRQAEEKSAET